MLLPSGRECGWQRSTPPKTHQHENATREGCTRAEGARAGRRSALARSPDVGERVRPLEAVKLDVDLVALVAEEAQRLALARAAACAHADLKLGAVEADVVRVAPAARFEAASRRRRAFERGGGGGRRARRRQCQQQDERRCDNGGWLSSVLLLSPPLLLLLLLLLRHRGEEERAARTWRSAARRGARFSAVAAAASSTHAVDSVLAATSATSPVWPREKRAVTTLESRGRELGHRDNKVAGCDRNQVCRLHVRPLLNGDSVAHCTHSICLHMHD